MTQTYYPQTEWTPEPTLTVGELIALLQSYEPTLPVCFRSPLYGAFGSHTAYTIESVELTTLPRREHHIPGGFVTDEEDGTVRYVEPETQVWNEWTGVILT
jgi:hypothetical protein